MEVSRVFDQARKAQGFKSQEQLDAFFAYTDHIGSCEVCSKPGPDYWITADASWQPTLAIPCEEGKALQRTWDATFSSTVSR